jgi:hypothetical protein
MKTYKPYEPSLLSRNLRSFKSFIKESTESRQVVDQLVQEGIINNTNKEVIND